MRLVFDSFAGVLDAVSKCHGGDLSAVAAALKSPEGNPLPYTTIASWRDRNSIPAAYWLQVEALARRCRLTSITVRRLAKIETSKRFPRARAA